MAKPELLETLHSIAQPIVASKGLSIWGIDLLQGARPLVRVYVDAPYVEGQNSAGHGIENSPENGTEHDAVESTNAKNQDMNKISATVERCAEISRIMGLTMEVEDIFSSSYILEVSSPGFSRMFFHLDQLRGFVGDNLEITLNDFLHNGPDFLHGRKKIKGKLESVNLEENSFVLGMDHGKDHITLTLDWDSVRKAVREHIFVMPEKPGKKRKTEK